MVDGCLGRAGSGGRSVWEGGHRVVDGCLGRAGSDGRSVWEGGQGVVVVG